MFGSTGTGLAATSYLSEDSDMLGAEAAYAALEADLQHELGNYESLHPGYDEYRFDLDEIKQKKNKAIVDVTPVSNMSNSYWGDNLEQQGTVSSLIFLIKNISSHEMTGDQKYSYSILLALLHPFLPEPFRILQRSLL